MVNTMCAQQARCASDYQSYLRDYVMTPTQFSNAMAAADAITEAIQRHDSSAFQLVDQGAHNLVLLGEPMRITIH